MLQAQTLLTTAKAAHLLGTHESSIKRWCNDGRLPTLLTDGGHRRIEFDSLLTFARENRIYVPLSVFGADAKYVWTGLDAFQKQGRTQPLLDRVLEWTMQRELSLLVEFFRHVGGLSYIPLQAVFDDILRPALYKVGEWWERGDISISHEHIVSHTYQHGLYALNERRQQLAREASGSAFAGRRRAIVGCAEGNQHEIAAFCIRSLLESQGWEVYYLGANVPTVEYLAMQRKCGAPLVCISYSPAAPLGDALRDVRVMRDLIGAQADFRLALGGANMEAGPLPSVPFAELRAFNDAAGFVEWTETL